jgi:predicted ATPase
VQYMTSQMEKLPQSYRLVLKLAACLGHSFEYEIFKKAKVTTKINLEDLLPRVTSLGDIQESGNNCYTWVHDQIHQAALGLIPMESREAFHLLIGTKLLMSSPMEELEKSTFDIVAQFSIGKRLLESDKQIYEVAELILLAGETALSTSSFSSAAAWLEGCQLSYPKG